MSKKSAKSSSFFEDDELFDAVDEALEKDIEEVPDDEYEPEIPVQVEPTRQGRPMIIRELRVDKCTTIRRRIPLTKSMCRRKGCNYDAVRDMGTKVNEEGKLELLYKEWKRVPPQRRQECLDFLQQHMVIAHSHNDEHIVFESDLKTEWFGQNV